MKRLPVYLALIVVSLLMTFPFYWIVISSLKSVEGMNLEPPSLYPAEPQTQNVSRPSVPGVVRAEGSTWLLLKHSQDLIGSRPGTGGYYVQLKAGKPGSLVKWFSNNEVKPDHIPGANVIFEHAGLQEVNGKEEVVLARMVRQKDIGFDELLFTVPAGGSGVIDLRQNPEHQQLRVPKAHWENYAKALKGPEASIGAQNGGGFLLFMRNSFMLSALSVLGQIVSSSLAAFGFARTRFRGRETLFIVLIATLMVPAQVTLIPLFIIFKNIGWMDSFWPLIVPHFTAGAFNVFLIRQFMLGLPRELDESGELDGASPLRIYRSIILPNCKPVLIVIGLFSFVASWQDVMGPLIYLDSPAHRTISLGLEYFRSPYVDNRPILMAGAVLSMLPVALIFLVAQRYILAGIATTGMKG